MKELFPVLAHCGYLFLFGFVFAEAVGLPLPAAVALVTAGAAAASGVLHTTAALATAIVGLFLGDCLSFVLGRYMGWALLAVLCKASLNPETCILRSAESFYKRGKVTLLIAKFIPGVNAMAAPLAGSMRMRFSQFARLDFVGAMFYASAYFALGFVFRDFLTTITHGLQVASHILETVVVTALSAYIVYRAWLYKSHSAYRVVPRVQVEELARILSSEERQNLLLVDVRSHGYYDDGAVRIKGSVRIEPNNLEAELKQLPKEKNIYLYCT